MRASFTGQCPECDEDITPGDEIQSVVSGEDVFGQPRTLWVHVVCPDSARLAAALRDVREGSVCGDCYQVRSVSGACGCDD